MCERSAARSIAVTQRARGASPSDPRRTEAQQIHALGLVWQISFQEMHTPTNMAAALLKILYSSPGQIVHSCME